MSKPLTTRTIGPLHFEDLEPKRFEDLVRGLIADFRNWYKIEGTGRTGSDDGFDVRCWESRILSTNEDDEGEESHLTYEGNLWQVQCKREKRIGPKKLVEHIDNSFDSEANPHGFLLAAPVDFSKKSRDKFREEMITRGVKEFFLWGKSELEDMLLQPKNGHLLFIFFGISMNIQKKSKVSELKYASNNKNKLISAFDKTKNVKGEIKMPVVIRDINDTQYPKKTPDGISSKGKRMWRLDLALQIHPKGLTLNTGKYYGYVDHDKERYDYFQPSDLRYFDGINHNLLEEFGESDAILDLWQTIPYRYRTKVEINALLEYERILHIDRYGDQLYPVPHLFTEKYDNEKIFNYTLIHDDQYDITEYERIPYFPKSLQQHSFGKIYLKEFLKPEFSNLSHDGENGENLYFCPKDDLKDIAVYDIIGFDDSKVSETAQKMYEVIEIRTEKITDLIEYSLNRKEKIEAALAREPKKGEKIKVLELRPIYKFRLERLGLIPKPKPKAKSQQWDRNAKITKENFPGLNE